MEIAVQQQQQPNSPLPPPVRKDPKLTRKARVQLTFAAKQAMDRDKPSVGDASLYNIFWDKWYSEDKYKGQFTKEKASTTRCFPEKDSGLTKAEEVSRDPFFCVFFARGSCGKGYDCSYLHRIPTDEDENRFERTRDCFGRERHRLDKDDLSGVGSFERDNKTLYVSKIGSYGDRMPEVIRTNFEMYGEVQAVKCLHSKGMAFVRYKNRLNAEFAKEAMDDQTLENNEVLCLRWATDDPNRETHVIHQEKAEYDFVEKFLQDPNKIQTLAFLHDTQTEGDLNRYYQSSASNYKDHLLDTRWSVLSGGKPVPKETHYGSNPSGYLYQFASGGVATTASGTQARLPPPPPPRKREAAAPVSAQPAKKALVSYESSDED